MRGELVEDAKFLNNTIGGRNRHSITTVTITGTYVIDADSPPYVILSAAAGQNVTLPAVEKGLHFYITASGAAALTVKNVGGTTIAIADPGATVHVISDGVSWYSIGGNTTTGVASGYKIARGATALDGANPTTVATGLSTIVSAVACLKGSVAPGDNTSVITVDFTGANGSLDLYGWKNTGGTDPTLVASTGTETVEWIAIGT